jgi:hypothetical protein
MRSIDSIDGNHPFFCATAPAGAGVGAGAGAGADGSEVLVDGPWAHECGASIRAESAEHVAR